MKLTNKFSRTRTSYVVEKKLIADFKKYHNLNIVKEIKKLIKEKRI
jgi:hypothetical protein